MQAFLARALIYIILAVGLLSCSKYQKLVKNGTPEEKLKGAKEYYQKKDYIRAQPLLEELMGLYFGKREREDIYLMLAYSHYGLSEYLIAGYHFRNFASTYPISTKKEEALYMTAICEYHKSLDDELDQTFTRSAINSLQSFINKYPNSDYVEDCNGRIDELRKRLLLKAYNGAKLYYQLGQYKAAMVACTNALEDFPDMINRDELHYLVADAAFIYADNSIQKLKEERFETALTAVNEYLKAFDSSSAYYNKVVRLKKDIEANLEEYTQQVETP